MGSKFSVSERSSNAPARVLNLEGELDLASVAELRGQFSQDGADETRRVVLDLSQLTFIDSTGLRALIEVQQRVIRSGGTMALVGPERQVLRVFEIAGLTRVFDLCGTLEEAIGPGA
jgi:anti-anti-sigma factor